MKTDTITNSVNANGKEEFVDFFSTTRIFVGDGKNNNANAVRMVRQHSKGFYLVIKIFDLNAPKNGTLFYTVKFHVGDTNKMFRLEDAWNMKEKKNFSFKKRIELVQIYADVLVSWRRRTSRIRNVFLIGDMYQTFSNNFFNKYCSVYTDQKGKFRFVLSIKAKVHLVIKYSMVHADLIFTAKYRFEDLDDVAKYYNMVRLDGGLVSKKSKDKASADTLSDSPKKDKPVDGYTTYYLGRHIISAILFKIGTMNNEIIDVRDNSQYIQKGSK